MSYINVGAFVAGARPASKKALRDALRDRPEEVLFDVTSSLGPRADEDVTPADIGTDKLSVTGPDPYTKRNWYGTVEVRNGKVRIS